MKEDAWSLRWEVSASKTGKEGTNGLVENGRRDRTTHGEGECQHSELCVTTSLEKAAE